jgi:hypothetical protein
MEGWSSGTLPANPEKFVALLQLNILQTVVFSDHKAHAVCKELTRTTSTTNYQRPTPNLQKILGIGDWELGVVSVSFEFLWSSY